MLAYQAPDKVDQIMDLIEFHPYTPNTMDSKEALMAELETIRSQGYAENNEEHELYMYSLTYPVRDHRGQVVAGISLSGIKEKILNMSQGMLHQSLKRAALQISRKLGYQGS
jgi:DNA-binding IclR family transcriptional regulator